MIMDMSYCILIINTMGRKLGSFYISVHKIEIWCLTFWTLGETTTRFLIKDIFESSMVLHLIIVVDSFNFICFSHRRLNQIKVDSTFFYHYVWNVQQTVKIFEVKSRSNLFLKKFTTHST